MALAESQPVHAFTHACLYARIKMATAGNGTARSGAYITGQPTRLTRSSRLPRGESRWRHPASYRSDDIERRGAHHAKTG